ncbi:hypothetical protein [uncultured Paludibaculum sp.]|uniref:hypothetical protein n=1 Tax=uncultured Paludibaculum sp. TaxID=1765020 RepID=UPI002AAA6E61|nr:hypothetical protein [uncultured Paludibaculum sp.]
MTTGCVAPLNRRSHRGSFRFLSAIVIAFVGAWFVVPQATGRAVRRISYQELLDRSDFVAIATASGRTADTAEEFFLPNISSTDGRGGTARVKCIGVETPFAAVAVLKGDSKVRDFVLHHCRSPQSENSVNGPILVFFDPSDAKRSGSYLLFLVREPDGRYAPTGGQTDPGLGVVSRLPFEDDSWRPR